MSKFSEEVAAALCKVGAPMDQVLDAAIRDDVLVVVTTDGQKHRTPTEILESGGRGGAPAVSPEDGAGASAPAPNAGDALAIDRGREETPPVDPLKASAPAPDAVAPAVDQGREEALPSADLSAPGLPAVEDSPVKTKAKGGAK